MAQPGLLSFVTSAYNTPIDFLKFLAQSVLAQDFDADGVWEWVLVDNGSTDPSTVEYIRELGKHRLVRVVRVEENQGVIGGVKIAVQHARYRYLLPIDSDDYIYPDTARIMSWYIQQHNFPPLLYSDEDKLDGSEWLEPYLKPDWDPVLFAHSCYIAHLCAIDRGLATMLGAYTDPRAQGCHDWDTFFRFLLAGYTPTHVPEVLYSWRKHPQSTAGNIDSKDYIHSSHRATLSRFVRAQRHPEYYGLLHSPLFNGTPDWWFRRKHTDSKNIASITIGKVGSDSSTLAIDANCDDLRILVERVAPDASLVMVTSQDLVMEHPDWPWEAIGLMELFPDTVMVGGPVYRSDGVVLSAGIYWPVIEGCGCPDRGRHRHDPGFFAQMWKQHSVDAMTIQNAVINKAFLLDALAAGHIPADAPIGVAGEWLGIAAMRWGKRVVYSPFLAASSDWDWTTVNFNKAQEALVTARRMTPEVQLYSQHLGIRAGEVYKPVTP